MQLPFITGDEIKARLDILGLVEAMRQGHRQPAPVMERVLMAEPDSDNSFLVWHAWAPGSLIAVKMGTIFPANPDALRPLPAVQAVITAFDGVDGSPRALLDGTELTYWKTAASSALAADFLAREDARTLLMVGAGGLAPYLARAHRAIRPSIDRVRVWNRSRPRADALAAELGGSVVEDLDDAVAEADVVCAATAATEPLIHGAVVRPGTHLDLVGGFTPEMRESDDEVARRARLFVDAAMFNIDHCGDLSQPIASGLRSRDDVEADLFGLCRGEHPGRTSPDDITLYKSGGGAHLDLMATRYALETLT
jgi:ornithine cyclodeaminase/alanine dehydrogenase-like protein (mu-crystallin family)